MKKLLLFLLVPIICIGADIPFKKPIIMTHKLKITWNANTEPDLAGYNLYYKTKNDSTVHFFSTSKHDTSIVVDFGKIAKDGTDRVYIWLTAYDTSGCMSENSQVVSMPVIADTLNYFFGDTNRDFTVNALDMYRFWQAFGWRKGEANYNPLFDFNVDWDINSFDHTAALTNFGEIMPDSLRGK